MKTALLALVMFWHPQKYQVCAADEVTGESSCTHGMRRKQAVFAANLLAGAPGSHLQVVILPVRGKEISPEPMPGPEKRHGF